MIFGKIFARTHNIEFQKRGYKNYVKQAVQIIVQQQQTPRGQNRIAQQPPHQQQQKRDQHKAKRTGNCAKLVAEKFSTLGEFSGHTNRILILPGWCNETTYFE